MSALAARRAREAEVFLETNYEAWKRNLLKAARRQLAQSNIRLDDIDLEAAYNAAWHALYRKLSDGVAINNPEGFLTQAIKFRALDDFRMRHPDRFADDVDVDVMCRPDEIADRLDDKAQIRHLLEGIGDRLDTREQTAANLCYVHGFSRAEAAHLMGIEERRFQKIMDGDNPKPGVAKKIAGLIGDIQDGQWCDKRVSLMKAYAFDILDRDGPRYQMARDHLAECPACRLLVRRLRGLAGVLPPVAMPIGAFPNDVATTVGHLHDILGSSVGVLDQARDAILHIASQPHVTDVALTTTSSDSAASTVARVGGGTAAAGGAGAAVAVAAGGGTTAGGIGSLLASGVGVKVAGCITALAVGGAACVTVTDQVILRDDRPAKTRKADKRSKPAPPTAAAARATPTSPASASSSSTSTSTSTGSSSAAARASASQPSSSASTTAPSAPVEFGFERGTASTKASKPDGSSRRTAGASTSAPSAQREFGGLASSPSSPASPAPSSGPTSSRSPSSRSGGSSSGGSAPSAASEFGFGG
jgi:DNA-directed RNA polymerase specialized sigma24 family protein